MRYPMLAVVAALFCLPATGVAASAPNGREVFAQLASLRGTWQGKTSAGRAFAVSYRFTAGDSVLVETWTLGSGRESMTLYALDGDRLLATHYCPQGNQPRLQFTNRDERGRLQFALVDGSNLHVPGKSHQQAFWLQLNADGTYDRAETYVDNDDVPPGATEPEDAVHYTRAETSAK